ncbi:MAG: DegV family protein [Dehalococcoidia bacterium]|nr:DegV family protein [Dehalococcoidia bacterium]
MKKVAVIVDAPAAVPRELAQEYEITVVPLHAIVDGKDYLENQVDMKWLYARLNQRETVPTTCFPSTGEFLEAYQRVARTSEAIVSIHMTNVFSKGYEAALEARRTVLEKLPRTRIEVIDSQTVEAGEMPIAIEAARAAKEGRGFDDVVQLAGDIKRRMTALYIFETLFYRDKGGRIFKAKPWAEAEARSASGFRAMIEVDASTGGTTKPIARAKTKRQLIEKAVKIARDRIGKRRLYAAIVHANVPEQAEELKAMLLSQFSCEEIHVSEALAVTAIQNGEGFISFGFFPRD